MAALNREIKDKSINKALQKLLSGKATQKEIELLKTALAKGEISIGGNVERSVVIVGSGNTVNLPPEIAGLLNPSTRNVPANEILPCPYRELFSFREEDADLFFGRESFVESLKQAVTTKSLTALIGSSGSGKTSVVFAGLIPQLRKDETWLILDMRPGYKPFNALAITLLSALDPSLSVSQKLSEATAFAKTLRDPDWDMNTIIPMLQKSNPKYHHILLVIDQFEELYTLVDDFAERHQFIDKLLKFNHNDVEKNITMLFTLRADFLGQVLAYRPLSDAFQDSDIKLGPMNLDELKRAIENPAKVRGVGFEEGLIELIIDDISKSAGTLPLLEFALTKLWELQDDNQLTLKAYQEIGGVENALTRYADMTFESLAPDEKDKARRIFTQLVNPGVGIVESRRLAMLKDLSEMGPSIVESFVKKRLLMTDRTLQGQETVEIVHEALIQGSKVLRGWIDKDREFLVWQAQLRVSVQQWIENGKSVDALLSGLSLSIAERWLALRQNDLGQIERTFILLSSEARKKELHVRSRNRKLGLLGMVSSFAIIIFVLVIAYLGIKTERDRAQVGEISVQSELLSDVYPDRSLLLALEAMNLSSPHLSSAEQALRDGIGKIGGIPLIGHRDTVTVFTVSPNGHWLATGSRDTSIRLWDLLSKNPAKNSIVLNGHRQVITAIAISPDGRFLASGDWGGVIRLWDLRDVPVELDILYGQASAITTLVFSPDGNWLASGSSDTTIALWDLKSTSIRSSLRWLGGMQNPVSNIIFSQDGKWLATKDGLESIWLWNIKFLNAPATILRHGDSDITTFSFSPDSRWVATAGTDANIRIWELRADDEPINRYQILTGHLDKIFRLAFSSDSRWIVSCSSDESIRVWDLTASDVKASVKVFYGHEDAISSLSFSSDGKRLASGDIDGSVRLWSFDSMVENTDQSPDQVILQNNDGAIEKLVFDPTNHWLASSRVDNVLELWDLRNVTSSRPSVKLYDVNGSNYQFTSDGHWLITASSEPNANLRLWDMTLDNPFENANVFLDHTGRTFVFLSANGSWLATYSYDVNDTSVVLRNLAQPDSTPIKIDYHTDKVNDIEFNPASTLLATASSDNSACLWDVSSSMIDHEPTKCFKGHRGRITSLDFSPDGRWLATGSDDQTIRLWNLDGGATLDTVILNASNRVTNVNIAPDGNWLIAKTADLTIQLWNLSVITDPKPVTFDDMPKAVSAVAFSPDGHWLAMAGREGLVQIWQLDSSLTQLANSHKLPKLFVGIRALQFSSNGLQLAAASKNIYLWDLYNLGSGKSIPDPLVFTGHSGYVNVIKFNPDNNMLATGGDDKAIRLWKLDVKDPSQSSIILNGHRSKITSLSFSPDGKWLISGSWDHTARLWDIQIEDMILFACQTVGRNLTKSEWLLYFPHRPYHITCPQWTAGK